MLYTYRSVFWLLFTLVAWLGISSAALADDTIRCESEGYKYNRCPARIAGPVQLEQQLSDAPCHRGETWGYDRRGIWVDKGCVGEFRVARRSAPDWYTDDRYGYNRYGLEDEARHRHGY